MACCALRVIMAAKSSFWSDVNEKPWHASGVIKQSWICRDRVLEKMVQIVSNDF